MRPVPACIPVQSGGSFENPDARAKKSLVAAERRRAKVGKQREGWFKRRIPAVSDHPERVVLIGETSVKTNMTRQRGWSPPGQRLILDAPFGARGTQTFIVGLSAGTMIAPWVSCHWSAIGPSDNGDGAMDGPAFAAYVDKVLVPELVPGTAVILDNLTTRRERENVARSFFMQTSNQPENLQCAEAATTRRKTNGFFHRAARIQR